MAGLFSGKSIHAEMVDRETVASVEVGAGKVSSDQAYRRYCLTAPEVGDYIGPVAGVDEHQWITYSIKIPYTGSDDLLVLDPSLVEMAAPPGVGGEAEVGSGVIEVTSATPLVDQQTSEKAQMWADSWMSHIRRGLASAVTAAGPLNQRLKQTLVEVEAKRNMALEIARRINQELNSSGG